METDFPEDAWPCLTIFKASYEANCARGRARMRQANLAICGLARNAGAHLPHTIARIGRIGSLFADYRVVFFENDSADDSLLKLQAWEQADPRVTILTERLGDPHWPTVRSLERTRQLAGYRNRYRDFVIRRWPRFDFVLVLDTDGLRFSLDGLANTFGQDDWDVVASQGVSIWRGRPVFYDTWAFRVREHPEAYDYKQLQSMVLPRGLPMLPVLSCFSGLAVYRMDALKAADYDGSDCEHVALHKKIAAAGHARIFMNPNMMTLYPNYEILNPANTSTPWWELPAGNR